MKLREYIQERANGVFMAHVYYGDPEEAFSFELVKTICKNGVDFLEFGIPFSDPTADGRTFINACTRALRAGMTPKKCIAAIKRLRDKERVTTPIIVTSYFNIVFQYGIEEFIKDIKDAGAQGLIIPEAVIEESNVLDLFCRQHGIALIYMIGPYSPEQRIKQIVNRASGFLYLISESGVTGAKQHMAEGIRTLLEKVRKHTNLPLLVGFGISAAEHVSSIMDAGADGAIMGSVIADKYERYIVSGKIQEEQECLREISDFTREIRGRL